MREEPAVPLRDGGGTTRDKWIMLRWKGTISYMDRHIVLRVLAYDAGRCS
jgi:hypothetical protein